VARGQRAKKHVTTQKKLATRTSSGKTAKVLTPVLSVGSLFYRPALSLSTLLGAVTVSMVHIPMLTELTGWNCTIFLTIAAMIFGPTLLCMLWVARVDPGQITENIEDQGAEPAELPKRTHKSRLYPKPIRRYDHYCRWLQNVVGLMNHREFMMMLIGLTLVAVLGVVIDPCLAAFAYKRTGCTRLRQTLWTEDAQRTAGNSGVFLDILPE